MFKCLEKYRLELKWDSVTIVDGAIATIKRPRFTGPALQMASVIAPKDSIHIDVTKQNNVLIGTWDIITFSWDGIESQTAEEVVFSKGLFQSVEIGRVKKLNKDDFFVIDTQNHEDAKHMFHLVYDAVLVNGARCPYDYKRV